MVVANPTQLCERCGTPRHTGRRFCSNRCATDARAAQHLAQFWLKVEKTDGCWLWRGRMASRGGYGRFQIAGTVHQAHRFAFALTYGQIPDGLLICHHCDNPPCVRPDHLFRGTTLANVHDKLSKHRDRRGVDHYRHKLTEDAVRAIREAQPHARSQRAIARQFNVSHWTVSRIWRGQSWTRLT